MDAIPSPQQVADDLAVDSLIEMIHNHPRADSRGRSITGFGYPHANPVVYIKYGDHLERGVDAEARTQKWAHDTLKTLPQSQRSGIHIPQIYRVVSLESWTIIVMEIVVGTTLEALLEDVETPEDYLDRCFERIELALKLFLAFPVPETASPGPCGGGLIRHPLFRYYQASIEYPTVEMLETHLNKVCLTLELPTCDAHLMIEHILYRLRLGSTKKHRN